MSYICLISQDTVLYHTVLFKQGSRGTSETHADRKLRKKASCIVTILPAGKVNCSKHDVFLKVRERATDRFAERGFSFPVSIP